MSISFDPTSTLTCFHPPHSDIVHRGSESFSNHLQAIFNKFLTGQPSVSQGNNRTFDSWLSVQQLLQDHHLQVDLVDETRKRHIISAIKERLPLEHLLPGRLGQLPYEGVNDGDRQGKGLDKLLEELENNETQICILTSPKGEQEALRTVCVANLSIQIGKKELHEDQYFFSVSKNLDQNELDGLTLAMKIIYLKCSEGTWLDFMEKVAKHGKPCEERLAKKAGISEKYPFGADPVEGDRSAFSEELGWSDAYIDDVLQRHHERHVQFKGNPSRSYFDHSGDLPCLYQISFSTHYLVEKRDAAGYPCFECKMVAPNRLRVCCFSLR